MIDLLKECRELLCGGRTSSMGALKDTITLQHKTSRIKEILFKLDAAIASEEKRVTVTQKYSDILEVQRREAENEERGSYMLGLYNGMLLICANEDNTEYTPMRKPQEKREPDAWMHKSTLDVIPAWCHHGEQEEWYTRPLYRSTASPQVPDDASVWKGTADVESRKVDSATVLKNSPTASPARDATLQVGEYTIWKYHEEDYWIEHLSGEGMQAFKHNFEKLIADFYKNNF